jgi:hypothetical protein
LLLDPWPNAGRRSVAALGCVEAAYIYRGTPATRPLANLLLRDRNALRLATKENAARYRAATRPLCRNGLEGIKALMLLSAEVVTETGHLERKP